MKIPKIYQPEIEVEFVGIKGFFAALFAICKVGIKKVRLKYAINFCSGMAGTVKVKTAYIIPKYRLKSVAKLSDESEVEGE